MFGLKLLLTRIIPFITLICFIAYGINIIFDIQGLTYLTTIQIGNQNYIRFDVQHYVQNLSTDLLESAFSDTFDIGTFRTIVDRIGEIWEDGYDFGDGIETIINGIIMILDGIITALNIIIIIIRLAIAILLTGLSLVGINIDNENSVILPALKDCVSILVIPLIQPF